MAQRKELPSFIKEIPLGSSFEEKRDAINSYKGKTVYIKDPYHSDGFVLVKIKGLDRKCSEQYIVETDIKEYKRLLIENLEGMLDPFKF